jgi:hypothetical protein
MLQMLTQSIEAVGSMDRMAIAEHIRKNKFKTLVGEISLPEQHGLDKAWTVGQWQMAFSQPLPGSDTPILRRST